MAQSLETHLNEVSKLLCGLNNEQKLRLVGDKLVAEDRNSDLGMIGTSIESREAVKAVLFLYKLGIKKGLPHIELLDALRSHQVCRAVLLKNADLLAELDQLEQDYIIATSKALNTISYEQVANISLYELANVKAYGKTPSLNACANYYNQLSYLFLHEVVLQSNLHMRTLSYKRWLIIATELFEQGDFLSLASLYAGISSAAFTRLKATQQGVDVPELNEFLTQLASLNQQAEVYGKMRQGMEQAYIEGATIVPHVSVLQNQLTLNNESINPALDRLEANSQQLKLLQDKLWSAGQRIPMSNFAEQIVECSTLLETAISAYKTCQEKINKGFVFSEQSSALTRQELNELTLQNQRDMVAAAQQLKQVSQQLMGIEQALASAVAEGEMLPSFTKLNKSIQADIARASNKILESNESLSKFHAYQGRLATQWTDQTPASSLLLDSMRAKLSQPLDQDKMLFEASLLHEPRHVKTTASTILAQLNWGPGARLKSLIAKFKHFVQKLAEPSVLTVEQRLNSLSQLPTTENQLREQLVQAEEQQVKLTLIELADKLAEDKPIANETQFLEKLFGNKQQLLAAYNSAPDDELDFQPLPPFIKASDLQNIVLNTKQGILYVCSHPQALAIIEQQEREPGAMLATLRSQASTKQELSHIAAMEAIVIDEILSDKLKVIEKQQARAEISSTPNQFSSTAAMAQKN